MVINNTNKTKIKDVNIEVMSEIEKVEYRLNKITKEIFNEELDVRFSVNPDTIQIHMQAYFNKATLNENRTERFSIDNPTVRKELKESGEEIHFIELKYGLITSEFLFNEMLECEDYNMAKSVVFNFILSGSASVIASIDWLSFVSPDLCIGNINIDKMSRDKKNGSRVVETYEYIPKHSNESSTHTLGVQESRKRKIRILKDSELSSSNEYIKALNEETEKLVKSNAEAYFKISHKRNVFVILNHNKKSLISKQEIMISRENYAYMLNIMDDASLDINEKLIEILLFLPELSGIPISKFLNCELKPSRDMKKKLNDIFKEEFLKVEKEIVDLILNEIENIDKEYREDFISYWKSCFRNKDSNIIGDLSTLYKYEDYEIHSTINCIVASSPALKVRYDRGYKDLDDYTMSHNSKTMEKLKETLDTLYKTKDKYVSFLKVKKYFEGKKKEISEYLMKDDFYKFRDLFNSKGEISKLKLEYEFDKNLIKICGNQEIELVLDVNIEKEIDNRLELIVSDIKDKLYKKINEFQNTTDIKEYVTIMSLVSHVENKGLTTYSNILKGANNENIRKNSYNKLEFYGAMKDMKKSDIEDLIDEMIGKGILKIRRRKSSYCSYDAISTQDNYYTYRKCLSIIVPKDRRSPEYEDKFGLNYKSSNCKSLADTLDTRAIKNIDALLEELDKETNSLKLEALIISAKNNIVKLEQSSIATLVEFIKNHRASYKDIEDKFIDFLVGITDTNLIPIFELNEKMVNGAIKNTLSKIISGLKARE